jgi:hypothetical protein
MYPPQLLRIEDARRDTNVRKFVTPDLKEGHYVVFTTSKPLPHDSKCGIKIGPDVNFFIFLYIHILRYHLQRDLLLLIMNYLLHSTLWLHSLSQVCTINYHNANFT